LLDGLSFFFVLLFLALLDESYNLFKGGPLTGFLVEADFGEL
jgi:hypothetical protein